MKGLHISSSDAAKEVDGMIKFVVFFLFVCVCKVVNSSYSRKSKENVSLLPGSATWE